MKNSVLKFALVASLALNLSVFAAAGYHYVAQSRYWVSPFGKVMEKDRFLFEELSLSPEQLSAMKTRARAFRAEIDKRRQEIVQKRTELVSLMRDEHPDKKAIDAVIKQISGMQEEMQRMSAGHMLEVKAALDKDQQQKFLDLIEQAMKSGRQVGCLPSKN
jgi:Spy/CpxP family protein refolding chaperone